MFCQVWLNLSFIKETTKAAIESAPSPQERLNNAELVYTTILQLVFCS